MNYYEKKERAALLKLSALLLLPDIPANGDPYSDGECFDPWDLFPALYGSYSRDFDDLAIAVLTELRDGTHNRIDLAGNMFRELLCTSGFCDYGTSPRVCFPTPEFAAMLPNMISRWQEYAAIHWRPHAVGER